MSDEAKPIIPANYAAGWYVVNMYGYYILRGPYQHAETAGAVRDEMERNASGRQNKRWNLGVVHKSGGTAGDGGTAGGDRPA